MFTTFPANAKEGTQNVNVSMSDASRPKRKQVARACDWCRLNRIRCDDKQPCSNCRNRGGSCSSSKPLSLAAANRYVFLAPM